MTGATLYPMLTIAHRPFGASSPVKVARLWPSLSSGSRTLILLVWLLFPAMFGTTTALAQPSTIEQKQLMMQRWKVKPVAHPRPYQTWQSDAEYNQDLRTLTQKFKQFGPKRHLPTVELFRAIATSFAGTPYRAGMLDLNKVERPVFYLSHLDCITLMDNSLALMLTIQQGKMTLDGFMTALETVRYRDGHCRGYASRLHYATDWFYDLEKRGIGTEISQQLGGIIHTQKCCLISGCDGKTSGRDSLQTAMRLVEADINQRTSYFLSFPLAERHFDSLRTGDIIGFTSFSRGLDVRHVGMIIRQEGKPYVLHASSDRGRTEIGFASLDNVLWVNNRKYSGLKVLRLR